MFLKLLLPLLLLCFFQTVTATSYVRGCYYSDWSHYFDGKGEFEPEMYIPGLCTHIFFAFAKVNDDFTAGAFDDEDTSSGPNGGYYKRINNLKNQQSDLKTLLSFGGWDGAGDTFKKLVGNEDHRRTFINSAMQLINQYGFDGIDIDWEYPGSGDYDNYVTFLRELKQADSSKLLTAAVTADGPTVDAGYNVPEMSKWLDYVNVMTYDFHGNWEQQTGENSPLYSSDNYNTNFAMNYWAQKGMPKEKLLVGIATYGYGWKLYDQNNNGMGAPGSPAPPLHWTQADGMGSYFEICNIGGDRHWDAAQKVPYRVNGNLWYGYDDASSIRSKMGWLKRNGFGGAFTWTLDMDDFNGQCPEGQKFILHQAMKDILG